MTAPIPKQIIRNKGGNFEAQVDGGLNTNIFIDKRYFHLLIPKKGKRIHVTGTSADYEGVGIVICQIGDDSVTIPPYSLYLMRDYLKIRFLRQQ